MVTNTRTFATCSVCGLTTLHPIRDAKGGCYCCHACREVAALLAAAPAPASVAESAGRAENAATVELTLGNLWCPSCAWLVGEQLRRTPGIIAADVNFIQQRAQLIYDQALTAPQKLQRRVRSLGYQASLPGETPHDEEESLFMRLIGCSVFVLHDIIVSFSIYARQLLGWNTPDGQWLIDFFQVMMLVSSLPVLFFLGLPILRAGFASLLRGQPNLHTLITVGTFSAFALSVYNLAAGSGGLYFDTATMLIYLVAIGRWLEIQAHKASSEAVERLLEQIPAEATLVTEGGDKIIPAAQLKAGMRVRVRPGERFPVDGLIATGAGDVDESLLTGEPRPLARQSGEAVKAGTISLDGSFELIATAVGEATAAGQIGQLLRRAMWQHSPLERMADKLSAWMTPAALALAALAFLFWNARSGPEHGLMVALSVLLIACPCALGLATPLTLWLSLGRAAESGAILRSTAALEQMARVKTIYFDKTGTLTRLPLQVQEIYAAEVDEQEFLQQLADAENASEHPLAKAIVAHARAQSIAPRPVNEFHAMPGLGLRARIDGETLWIGNRTLMNARGLTLSDETARQAAAWHAAGRVVVYVGVKERVIGIVALGETQRADSPEMIAALRADGFELAVLTGDDERAGAHWQKMLNVPVHAALNPDAKMERIRRTPGGAAMLGDGINDGPALAAAAVGLAMSRGTDVAQSAADVVLVRDDLRAVPWLFGLARAAMRRVNQNLVWAVIYNLVGVVLALAGLLQPLFSALAMVASSLFVTGNAMRMRKYPILEEK